MTAVATRPDSAEPIRDSRRIRLTGTWALTRLALRRDRIKLPVWIASVVGLAIYSAVAIKTIYPTTEDLEAIVAFVSSPAGVFMTGPGYGIDQPTHEIVFAAMYGLYVMIAAGFMNVLLMVRHTRADEETARAELLRASVVGRYAPLTAAGIVALAANAVTAVLLGLVLSTVYDPAGAWMFGISVGLTGMVFAGITAVGAQVVEHARSATVIGSAAVGISVIVRGIGDVMETHGSWVSWLSPIGWAQQTRVFYDARWWPLLLSIAAATLTIALAYRLQARRDFGAGLVAAKPGNERAHARLKSPLMLALRLDRSSIIGWTVGVALSGALYGGLAKSVQDSLGDLPDEILAVLGGDPDTLMDGFFAAMALTNVLLIASYGILSVHRLAVDESSGRAEVILATAASRIRWMGSVVVTALTGATLATIATGALMGVTVSATLGESGYVRSLILAHLAYLPAVAVVIAIAALGFGIRPGLASVAWAFIGLGLFIGYFGEMMELPDAVMGISPFYHVGQVPLEDPDLGATLGLAAVAAAGIGLGLAWFRRRDLTH